MVEQLVEYAVDAELVQVGAEPHQARDAGQMGVGLADVDRPGVGSANAAGPVFPVPALAAEDVPPCLVEDGTLLRRALCATVSTSSGAQALGLLPMFAELTCSWHLGGARRVGFGDHTSPPMTHAERLFFWVFATVLPCCYLDMRYALREIHVQCPRPRRKRICGGQHIRLLGV